jgi:SOS-response transcriptional repressor LexA
MKKPINLTDTQKDILDYLCRFLCSEQRTPTTRELAEAFGWKSQTAAVSHLDALAKKGYIERNETGKVILPGAKITVKLEVKNKDGSRSLLSDYYN